MKKEKSNCALHSWRVEKAGMRMAYTTPIYNRFRTANGSRVWTAINGNLFSKLAMVWTLVSAHRDAPIPSAPLGAGFKWPSGVASLLRNQHTNLRTMDTISARITIFIR
jgi:hypothetical protein